MGCAGVGARRHSGHIAGFEKEESRGRGAGARGSGPDDHGNRAAKDLLDDIPRRVHQAARSAEANQHGVGMIPLRLCDGGCDHVGGDRMDNAIYIHLQYSRLQRRGGEEQNGNRGHSRTSQGCTQD